MTHFPFLRALSLLGTLLPALAHAQTPVFGDSTPQSLRVSATGFSLFSSGTLSIMGSVDYAGSPAQLTGTTVINGDLRLRAASTLTVRASGKLYVYGNAYLEDGALTVEPGGQVFFYGAQLRITPSPSATSVGGGGSLAFISPRPAAGQSADGQQRPQASDGLAGGAAAQYVDGSGVALGLSLDHRSATALVLTDLNGDNKADLTLSGTLTLGLDDAPLVLGDNSLVLDQSSGGTIAGYSPRRYVQTSGTGLLRAAAVPAGSSFVFPIGQAASGDYTPLQLTNRLGNAGTYSARALTTPPTRPAQPTAGRFWQLVAADAAATFDLVLEHNLSTNDAGYNDQSAAIVRYDGSAWTSPGAPAAGTSPGTLSTTGPTSGSSDLGQGGATAPGSVNYFTKVTPATPLPVTLLAFTAQRQSGASTVRLAWQTASELNNAGFEVFRSLDGKTWHQLDYVPGNGTTAQQHSYQRPTPYVGAAYYRLRQVDFNGTGTYSPVRAIGADPAETVFSVYPNPSGGELHVMGAAPDEPIRVLNAVGQLVAEFPGSELSQDLTGKLASGLYIVRQGRKQAHFTVR